MLRLVPIPEYRVACWNPNREREINALYRVQKIAAPYTRCGNKETGLLLLLISGHVDDEEEGRALTRGLPSTVTQRFIHAHRLVWP